jgi:hypothetical protein
MRDTRVPTASSAARAVARSPRGGDGVGGIEGYGTSTARGAARLPWYSTAGWRCWTDSSAFSTR